MVKHHGRNYISGMEHNLKQKIGLRVKAARMQKGMTQPQLAEVINKAFETVSNIERGKTAPNFQTLLDISVALGVPMRDFFDGVENSEPENKRQELVIQSQVLAGQMNEQTLALWQKLGEVLLEEQNKE